MMIPILVLIGERLKKIPILGKLVDERFLSYRRRAQRIAGLTGFLLADALLAYRQLVHHVWNWDLLAIVLAVTTIYLVLITCTCSPNKGGIMALTKGTLTNTWKASSPGSLLAGKPSQHDLHSTSIFKTIFTGPNGLRAGWRLLIFAILVVTLLAIFLLIRNGGVEGLKQSYAHRGEITITPLLMGEAEVGAFLLICLATFIMSRIERRKFSQYGLPLRQFLRKELWVGMFGGFLTLSGTLLVMFLLRGFRVTGFALHGSAIFSSMLAWGAAFVLAGMCGRIPLPRICPIHARFRHRFLAGGAGDVVCVFFWARF